MVHTPTGDSGNRNAAGNEVAAATPQPTRTAGRILVDQLRLHGAKRLFGVPGESYLPVLDALHDTRDSLPFTVCRHEAGAAHMAEAWGKLGQGPGICFVTRGPGATHAAIGVHTAWQDSTPMLLFIGQVGTDFEGREAFQEVDYGAFFGSMTKAVIRLDRVERFPECIARAFALACSGRPGPVVLVLPEDVLGQSSDVADAVPYRVFSPGPAQADMAALAERLAIARRPLLLVGGSDWDAASRECVRRFAHRFQLPVACAWRYQDAYDNTDDHYVGEVGIGINPRLAQRVRDADLLIAVGVRLGEMTTSGYSLLTVPRPSQTLIHVHPSPDEPGRVYQPDLAICAGNRRWAQALDTLLEVETPADRRAWCSAAHEDYVQWRQPPAQPGELDYPAQVLLLDRILPPDAILTNGAGNYATPVHRLYRHRQHKTQLAPTSGAMGYALPAAIAAKLKFPDRMVVAFTGDGDFQMTSQELATAHQEGAGILVFVVDNGMYGTIRMHQERQYPGRVSATDLRNPDFAALARACHCHGELVTDNAAFLPAFERAVAATGRGQPAVLVLRIDPEALTINQTLSQMRDAAQQRRS